MSYRAPTYGSSPWGAIQHVTKIMRGVAFVSTSGHGGVRVSRGVALKRLSEEARKRAIETKAYFFFEEDCKYAIPLWEIPEAREILNSRSGSSCTRESLLSSLSRWEPDYLIARGETPLPERYEQWKVQKLDEQMRRDRHPNLIVCARGDTPHRGQCTVTTADGKNHVVTTESYRARSTPNLLSDCELVTAA